MKTLYRIKNDKWVFADLIPLFVLSYSCVIGLFLIFVVVYNVFIRITELHLDEKEREAIKKELKKDESKETI